MTNDEYARVNQEFRKACKEANVAPTKRQASKFRMGRGRANKAVSR